MNLRDDETLTRETRVPGVRGKPRAPEPEPAFERYARVVFWVLIAALIGWLVAGFFNQAAWRIGQSLPMTQTR